MLQADEVELESPVSKEEFPNSLYCENCDIYMTIEEIDVDFSEESVVLRGSCYMPHCKNTGVGSVVPTTEMSKRVYLEIP
jgi:hypothetical protein